MINRARRGMKIPELYKVAGLDALDEAIGRCTEMGRPVHFAPGFGEVQNAQISRRHVEFLATLPSSAPSTTRTSSRPTGNIIVYPSLRPLSSRPTVR